MQTEERRTLPTRLSRRMLLLGAVTGTAVIGGGVFASTWFNVFADASADGALTLETAYAQADAGQIYLIDIRRPDEWEETGVAVPAIPLDMRRDDFAEVLKDIFAKSGERPVALICARGVRSDRMNQRLVSEGFGNILDVPQGMLGSGAGPGYAASGLPLREPTAQELDGEVAGID